MDAFLKVIVLLIFVCGMTVIYGLVEIFKNI